MGKIGAAGVAILVLLLAGCGGPDLTTGMRGGLDSGLGGGYGSYGAYGGYGQGAAQRPSAPRATRGVYPKAEIALEIPDVQGNPFDYTENDVLLTITRPDQSSVRVPAFFDGGTTWKVRYTPDMTGRHAITAVTLNGKAIQPSKMEPREFQVTGAPLPGFVRRDPRNRERFIFDNGSVYYPLGMNIAWGDVVPILGRAGQAGINWARVWMCHWGNTNLDWVMNKKLGEGELDLETARRWDAIIEAAEKAGVYVQVVLQHHGQYSTRVNPNWSENPWNKQNGGFLATPGEFFVHPKARALTQSKYRYILARWGYSPNVMAWELFNEVEWTDSIANKHADEVVAWHNAMAQFLRQHDPYHHLVTTSSSLEIPGLFQNMDYVQPHAYPPDALAVTGRFDVDKLDKPVFYGEIGPGGLRDDGSFLHRALWSSIMSRTAGAAQYWMWDAVDQNNWYDKFEPAATFVRQSGILAHANLRPISASVTTRERGPLTLRPGGGWATLKQTELTVPSSGAITGLGEVPSFFQGKAHRDMFAALTLKTVFPEDGTITVHVQQVSRAGGNIRIVVDGSEAAVKEFQGSDADRRVRESVTAKVAAGARSITIENTGADWVVVSGIALEPYAPALGLLGKANETFGALWVYNRLKSASSGKITVAGVKPGDYDIVWYDTATGQASGRTKVTVAPKSGLVLDTPAISTDAAVTFAKAASRTVSTPKPNTARTQGPRTSPIGQPKE